MYTTSFKRLYQRKGKNYSGILNEFVEDCSRFLETHERSVFILNYCSNRDAGN
jgi:hypothetical protein